MVPCCASVQSRKVYGEESGLRNAKKDKLRGDERFLVIMAHNLEQKMGHCWCRELTMASKEGEGVNRSV